MGDTTALTAWPQSCHVRANKPLNKNGCLALVVAEVGALRRESKMEKLLERKETFIVRQKDDGGPKRHPEHQTETLAMPGGHRVHALDRKVFDRAVKTAMKSVKR